MKKISKKKPIVRKITKAVKASRTAGAKAQAKVKAKKQTISKSQGYKTMEAVRKSKPAKAGKIKLSKSAHIVRVKPKATVKTITARTKNVWGPTDVKPYQLANNEEYMSDKQLKHFRSVLLNWKSQLMEEVDRTMHHMQDEASNFPDPIDRASQEEEFNLELRTRDRERKLLRKIEETLNRIDEHDYGYCDDCGAEIGVRRLEARPTANQCIECKTIAEIREKQVGDGS